MERSFQISAQPRDRTGYPTIRSQNAGVGPSGGGQRLVLDQGLSRLCTLLERLVANVPHNKFSAEVMMTCVAKHTKVR